MKEPIYRDMFSERKPMTIEEWRKVFGAGAEFVYSGGNQNKILIMQHVSLNGERVKTILEKVEN